MSTSGHHLEEQWLQQAVDLAVASVGRGGGPFGAVIVHDVEVVATGTNQVTASLDPTAHAEVVAIRAACAALGDFSLSGCVLYSSCEPCPMCAAAALWARLDRVAFAADRDDAAEGGFDDRAFHHLFTGGAADRWPTPVVGVGLTGGRAAAVAPFRAWQDKPDRIDY